jgi:hypothetical protein
MATKRKTGKDYTKELQDLSDKRRRLKAVTAERLFELATEYPNVKLPTSRAGGLKCREISNKLYIDELNLDYIILYIRTIEDYIASQHPHKQTKIEGFN